MNLSELNPLGYIQASANIGVLILWAAVVTTLAVSLYMAAKR